MTKSTKQLPKREPFLMLKRNKETEELLKKPDCFILLTQIALRAKRNDDLSIHNLKIGESFIGDYKNIGLTERRYRTAKSDVQRYNLATFKATNRGTIAKLTGSSIYDINESKSDEPDDRLETGWRRTDDEPDDRLETTKKKLRSKELKEVNNIRNIYTDLSDGLNFILEEKLNRKLNHKSWSKDIKLLIEKDLVNRTNAVEDVQKVIQEISNRFGEKYFPVIQSGASLREKFSKVESSMQRGSTRKLTKGEETIKAIYEDF